MKNIWFDFWGCLIDVKIVKRIPRGARYLCTDFDEGLNYYDVDEDYIVAVADADMP